MLNENAGRLPLSSFETKFADKFAVECQPSLYGFQNCALLLQALSNLIVMRGKGSKRVLLVNKDMAGICDSLSFSFLTQVVLA